MGELRKNELKKLPHENKNDLISSLKNIWANFDTKIYALLINSMANCLIAVIIPKGDAKKFRLACKSPSSLNCV